MTVAQILLLAVLAGLLAVAAIGDVRRRIIPNRLNAAVAVLAVGWWWAGHYGAGVILLQIGCALGILLLFGGCFALGMMGGGDVKLLVALALWFPPAELAEMLVFMALGGGVLTVAMLAWHALRRLGQPEIPYGVAIVGAAFLVMTNTILTTSPA